MAFCTNPLDLTMTVHCRGVETWVVLTGACWRLTGRTRLNKYLSGLDWICQLFWRSIYVFFFKATCCITDIKQQHFDGHLQDALNNTRVTTINQSHNNCVTQTQGFSLNLCRSWFGLGREKQNVLYWPVLVTTFSGSVEFGHKYVSGAACCIPTVLIRNVFNVTQWHMQSVGFFFLLVSC